MQLSKLSKSGRLSVRNEAEFERKGPAPTVFPIVSFVHYLVTSFKSQFEKSFGIAIEGRGLRGEEAIRWRRKMMVVDPVHSIVIGLRTHPVSSGKQMHGVP